MVETLRPLTNYQKAGNSEILLKGRSAFRKGQLGCLILAGGEGTRLGFDGPKGTYPLTRFRKKSLFQLFCEKVQAAGARAGVHVPIAIMTSPLNDAQIKAFFKQHDNFGVGPDDLHFFTQQMLPLLDDDKAPIEGHNGPDGNGYTLKRFYESRIWEEWDARGIKYVHSMHIDNPLCDPCDEELLGWHIMSEADATIKCIDSKAPDAKMGIIAECEGRPKVVEYFKVPEATLQRFSLFNTGMFCFSMRFIEACHDKKLPIHLAKKRRGDQTVWKQESFIFDLLPFAKKVSVIAYDRSDCFAPLKNKDGVDSPQKVLEAMQQYDRKTIEAITGREAPSFPFELASEFYYPTEELLHQWLGKELSQSEYIEP